MLSVLKNLQVVQSPFGLDFEFVNQKLYIPAGSALNCLGYNDHLERMIGVVRTALGILALATSEGYKERTLAGLHIFRGILEMQGSFELYLLILDIMGTVYNVAHRILFKQTTEEKLA